MLHSVDVDLYLKHDVRRAVETDEIHLSLGLGSPFEQTFGYYADPVTPALPTLPAGWEQRLLSLSFHDNIIAWFLEPNDAAISKYARGSFRDRAWIHAGLDADILHLPIIRERLADTRFFDDVERERVFTAVTEDTERLKLQK